MIEHALDVLRTMVKEQERRQLTACEKLACRALVPHVGMEAMRLFCEEFERGNPLYRRSHLGMRLDAIQNNIRPV